MNDADQLLRDVDVTQSQFPFFSPLADFRQQIRSTLNDKVKAMADGAYRARDLGRALQLYERLQVLGHESPERTSRVLELQTTRKTSEERASELFQKGDVRKAHAALAELAALFPHETALAEKVKHYSSILDRVKHMSEVGIRELLNQRRLVQLDREISWLQSTRMNIQKLPDIAANVRKKLAEANNAIARAHAEMTAGNVRAAQNIAREILETVSDHDEANSIVRQSSVIVDKVAQVQACVEQQQWCAARVLEREVEAEKVNDPRLPKLSAKIKEEISVLDNQLLLLGIVAVLMSIMVTYGIPWLAASYFSDKALPAGYYLASIGAAFMILLVIWVTFRSKTQTIQRVWMIFPARQRRSSVPSLATMSPGSSQHPPSLDVSSTVLSSVAQTPAGAVSQPLPLRPLEDSHGKTTVVMQTILTQPEIPAVKTDALSSTELDQRLETTCFAIEWLAMGLITSILGVLLASPLAHLVKIEWLKVPTVFVVHQAFILSAFLLLNRFNRWQWPVLAWALSTLVIALASYLTTNDMIVRGCYYLLTWTAIGLMSAILLRTHYLKSIAAAVAGPLVSALLASPFIVGMLFLVGLVSPTGQNHALGQTMIALFSTSMIWCLIAVALCSSSGTLVRLIAVDQTVVRGIFAVALALITGCLAYCLVASFSLIMQEKIRWIASWILLFLFCQAVIPFLRLQWKAGRMLATTLITSCLLALLAIGEWLAPGLPLIVFAWCLSATSVVLLRTRSLDTFQYDQEFKARLRTHLRTKRIPFSIQIRRVN